MKELLRKVVNLKISSIFICPNNFGQPNTITWDSTFKAGQQLVGAMGGLTGKIADFFKSNNMKWAGQKLKEMSTNGIPTQDLGELKSGMLPNPYLSQLFRGVDFRNFQYTFRFVPFTPADCDNIKEIITVFRKWALPAGPAGGGASPYLQYPGEVDVQYQFQDGENTYIHKFKRSVITSLDIDYTRSRNVDDDEKSGFLRKRS